MAILSDIKTMLGLRNTDAFDTELIIFINSAFATLRNLRVGPDPALVITDKTPWSKFIKNERDIESVKEFVYLHVRLVFDPPTGGVLTAYQEQLKELGFRLSTATNNN